MSIKRWLVVAALGMATVPTIASAQVAGAIRPSTSRARPRAEHRQRQSDRRQDLGDDRRHDRHARRQRHAARGPHRLRGPRDLLEPACGREGPSEDLRRGQERDRVRRVRALGGYRPTPAAQHETVRPDGRRRWRGTDAGWSSSRRYAGATSAERRAASRSDRSTGHVHRSPDVRRPQRQDPSRRCAGLSRRLQRGRFDHDGHGHVRQRRPRHVQRISIAPARRRTSRWRS